MRGQKTLQFVFFLLPALFLLSTFLIYPIVYTFYLSFHQWRGFGPMTFVGWANYLHLLRDEAFLQALANNLMWIVVFVGLTVGLGLLLATLIDRVRYGNFIKSIVFFPMVISYVAAGLIWKFVYDRTLGSLNAILNGVGINTDQLWNRGAWMGDMTPILGQLSSAEAEIRLLPVVVLAIIMAAVWMWTGFATVILSAGLKNIPQELIEAARIDGANEFQVFRKIIIPLLWPVIIVLIVTLAINVLKIFDLVYAMAGKWGGPAGVANVIALHMFRTAFAFGEFGYGSTVAVILFVFIVPFMLLNVQRLARKGEL